MTLAQDLTVSSLLRRHGGSSDALACALSEATAIYVEELREFGHPAERQARASSELNHFLFWLRELKDQRVVEADRKVRDAAREVSTTNPQPQDVRRLLAALQERDRL